jgi:hypothetical protein
VVEVTLYDLRGYRHCRHFFGAHFREALPDQNTTAILSAGLSVENEPPTSVAFNGCTRASPRR